MPTTYSPRTSAGRISRVCAKALPAPKSCWDILGLRSHASMQDVKEAYRRKAMTLHPDQGGSDAAMVELNRARDEALKGAAA